MKYNHIVYNMLNKLDENGIEYVILRDFIPLSNIETSLDVDVFIPRKYKKIVKKIFKQEGWYTPFFNANKYPHEQFIYVSEKLIHKIDIVYSLNYSNKLYEFSKINLIQDRVNCNNIYIPNYSKALLTLFLHIILDKKHISTKNKRVFDKLYDECISGNYEIEEDLLSIYSEIRFNECEYINRQINKYIKIIMKKDILEEFNIKNYIYILKSKLCYILSSLFKIFWENGICLVGVDGSGKSTTVYNLEQILIPHVKIQYMGFKDWELKFVRNHFENTKDTKIYKLQSIIYVYIEMWYRYIKSRFSRKLVIYDRFVDEAYINASGLSKKIYTILYKYLFPKPKQYIYLYCDLDTSLSRKDDILDKEQFRNMKDRFDLIFLNKEMIPCYSSDELSTEMILADIIKLLNRKYQKFLI